MLLAFCQNAGTARAFIALLMLAPLSLDLSTATTPLMCSFLSCSVWSPCRIPRFLHPLPFIALVGFPFLELIPSICTTLPCWRENAFLTSSVMVLNGSTNASMSSLLRPKNLTSFMYIRWLTLIQKSMAIHLSWGTRHRDHDLDKLQRKQGFFLENSFLNFDLTRRLTSSCWIGPPVSQRFCQKANHNIADLQIFQYVWVGYQAICLPIINPYHTLVLYPLSRGAFLYIPFVFLLWRFWSKNLWRLSVIGLERTIYITGRYVIGPSLLTLLLFHIEIVLVTHWGTVPHCHTFLELHCHSFSQRPWTFSDPGAFQLDVFFFSSSCSAAGITVHSGCLVSLFFLVLSSWSHLAFLCFTEKIQMLLRRAWLHSAFGVISLYDFPLRSLLSIFCLVYSDDTRYAHLVFWFDLLPSLQGVFLVVLQPVKLRFL